MQSDYWYTYKLCYPNGTPFYFGKGKGDRAYQHKRHAKKNEVLRDRVINDILFRKLDIIVKIIAYYKDENEAYRTERENIRFASVTELLTNVIYNHVPHNWKKHLEQLNIPLQVFQTTLQPWPDEVYQLGATIQPWSNSTEEVALKRRHANQIMQDILIEVATSKNAVAHIENKSKMIAEYEKMITERKLLESPIVLPPDREDQPGDEDREDQPDDEDREDRSDGEDTYPEENECGYCGEVFNTHVILDIHYAECEKKKIYNKIRRQQKKGQRK